MIGRATFLRRMIGAAVGVGMLGEELLGRAPAIRHPEDWTPELVGSVSFDHPEVDPYATLYFTADSDVKTVRVWVNGEERTVESWEREGDLVRVALDPVHDTVAVAAVPYTS